MKTLREKHITARRHELFDKFAAQALLAVPKDPAGACKLAETALKALSGAEHEPENSPATPQGPSMAPFEEDLKRAYADTQPKTTEPKPE
jgi:hypothetical protein